MPLGGTGEAQAVGRAKMLLLEQMMSNRRVLLVAIGCIGVLAFVGLTVDFGRVYFERLRVVESVDVAALAGGANLPQESVAHERALTSLREYRYNRWIDRVLPPNVVSWLPDELAEIELAPILPNVEWGKVRIVVNPGDSTENISGPSEADAVFTIWIDTAFSRDLQAKKSADTANRMRIRIREQVSTIFLWLVGVRQISVEHTAETSIVSNLLIAVIKDVSGVRSFRTLCFGCWMEDCAYQDCWTRCDIKNAPTTCVQGRSMEQEILASLDSTEVTTLTSTIDGMRRGISVLRSKPDSYREPSAAIILIADRVPTLTPEDEPPGQECWREDLWTDDHSKGKREQQATDCAMYYAREAAKNNLVVYTVSVGSQVDRDLMREVARVSFGGYVWVSTIDELDKAFDYLFGSRSSVAH